MGARSNLLIYLMERNKLLLTLVYFPLFYPLEVLVTFCLTFHYLIRGNCRVFADVWRSWCVGLRGENLASRSHMIACKLNMKRHV